MVTFCDRASEMGPRLSESNRGGLAGSGPLAPLSLTCPASELSPVPQHQRAYFLLIPSVYPLVLLLGPSLLV